MGISDWPAAERPREKLLERGAGALSDAELLAIFLRTGVAGTSAVDLARQMLVEYGSLDALLASNLPGWAARTKSRCYNAATTATSLHPASSSGHRAQSRASFSGGRGSGRKPERSNTGIASSLINANSSA